MSDDDDDEDRTLDLLVRFFQNVFKKVSKRARKAVRSVLPLPISSHLVLCCSLLPYRKSELDGFNISLSFLINTGRIFCQWDPASRILVDSQGISSGIFFIHHHS